MNTPKRALQIISSGSVGGILMMILNLYRAVDRERLQFDFIVYNKLSDEVENEITRLGGKVFCIKRARESGILRFIGNVGTIIRENGPYTAMHAHMDHQSGLAAAAAKKAGVKRRLCHAHLDTRGVRGLALKKMAGRVLIDLYITQRCACSTLAGEALYGRRAVKKGLVRLVNNGIDLTGYAYREAGHREALLKECGVTGDPVLIGNVARLDTVKNQDFILDLALEAKKRGLPYVFVFAGIGRSQEHLLEKRARLELGDNTFFLGNRKDIPQLLQSMDLFLLPSLREGLPLTIVEAQSAGLPIVAADCVPLEADMGLGLMERLSLQDGIETWLQAIQNGLTKERPGMERRLEAVRSRGFDVKSNVAVIMDLYGV